MGVTLACFSVDGMMPVESERLKICASMVLMEGMICFKRLLLTQSLLLLWLFLSLEVNLIISSEHVGDKNKLLGLVFDENACLNSGGGSGILLASVIPMLAKNELN